MNMNTFIDKLAAATGLKAPSKPKGSDFEVITDALVTLALPDLQRAIPDVMKQAVATEQAKKQCQRLIHDSGEDAAMSAFLKQQTDLAEQAANGKLTSDDVWDLEDFREDFANRRRAALDAWTTIDKAQEPTRTEVVARFLEIVGSYISEVEANDRASYARLVGCEGV